jgi:hypothetical protein
MLYTASLLTAPVPMMLFEKGTREFALAVIACGLLLSLSSLYVVEGEIRLKPRSLLGVKLLTAATITLLFGLSMTVGSMVYLIRS